MYAKTLARMRAGDIDSVIDSRAADIKAVEAAIDAAAERRAFARATRQELGYSDLETAIDKETPDVPVDVVLLKSLRDIGVRPFTVDSVTAYMSKKAFVPTKLAAQIFGGAFIAVGVVGLAIEFVSEFMTVKPLITGAAIPMLAFWTHALIVGIGIAVLTLQHKFMPKKFWEEVHLNNAGHLVPRGALEIARALRAKQPGAGFRVVQLKHEYGQLLPDPFLKVVMNHESYYIAVWDEPGFDGKLMQVD